MRRQSQTSEALLAGQGRSWRLDPRALPVSFTASDPGADERVRLVELHRERVVLRRAVRGIRMAVNMPVRAFLGVSVRVLIAESAGEAVSVVLEHRDPALSVPLFSAPDSADVIAEWQLWANVFGLPLLVVYQSGDLREPFLRLGAVRVATICPRRRRHNAVKTRRPTILLRRRPGLMPEVPLVHHGEREIIARN